MSHHLHQVLDGDDVRLPGVVGDDRQTAPAVRLSGEQEHLAQESVLVARSPVDGNLVLCANFVHDNSLLVYFVP